jgi:hypothetical protein
VRAAQIGFPELVQDFFLRRLITQRGASMRTVEAYRDAFELLLGYAQTQAGKKPHAMMLADLDAPLVLDFLDHLETERGNSVRTRNARLAAIHSFMRYAALRDPASLPVITRVLAIPAKRYDLERTPRHRTAGDRLQHRRTRLRTHRPAGTRRPTRPGHRRAPARQRTQGTSDPALEEHRPPTTRLAQRTPPDT